MKAIGQATINPVLFYSGKVCGYVTWLMLLLSLSGVVRIGAAPLGALTYASYVVLALGLAITTISMINLGSSTRLGLPVEQTTLRQNGLYRISRNPMYLGFNLITVSSMMFHWNVIVVFLGLFSIATYHLIITGEERFLEKRFGQQYQQYRATVRRYL